MTKDEMRKVGREGEEIARLFINQKIKPNILLQMDWGFKKNGEWYSVEVKHQERYVKWKDSDIEGHGLPPWQVRARMELYKDKGIRCLFLVLEKGTGNIFWQWLDVLENKKYIETRNNPRRIYEISGFVKSKLKHSEGCFFMQKMG